jgi:uncharacterized ferritin-like protein (DUF455 family)
MSCKPESTSNRQGQAERPKESATRSKRHISGLAYVLRRLVDCESAWVARFPEWDDKITCSLALGYTTVSLQTADARLSEQIPTEPRYRAPSEECARAFDRGAEATSVVAIRQFVCDVTESVLMTVEVLMQSAHPLFDHPSRMTLRAITLQLAEKRSVLRTRKWAGSSSPYDFALKDESFFFWDKCTLKPELLDVPARPDHLIQDDRPILSDPLEDMIRSGEGLKRFCHFVYADIEVCAAEICARNIAEYSASMPIQFAADMARQCSDEARHALMIGSYMDRIGVSLGDYTYTNSVWTNCLNGRGIAERLAIEQVISEGNGLDETVALLKDIQNAGLNDLADLYTFLLADETVHCRFGNIWLMWLAKGDRTEFERIVTSSLKAAGLCIPGRAPVAQEVRRIAGFPDWFVQTLLLREPSSTSPIGVD